MNRIDFGECLKDSPAYRNQLRQATEQIELVGNHLEQMFRLCNSLLNNGKLFLQDFQKFFKCFIDVRDLFSSDEFLKKTLTKFENYSKEIQTLFANLIEQTTQTSLRTLTRMIKEDIKKVEDQGKLFERLSSDYDLALQRHADASKSKPHLCEDTEKILIATRSCFGHASIDYSCQINVLFDQQKVDLIELLLSYINFHKAFFHQGYETLVIDTERDFNQISSQINQIRQENVANQNDLEKLHEINQQRYNQNDVEISSLPMLTESSVQQSNLSGNSIETIKEGYLFKRSHKKFKTWSRRWFFIRQGQLLYMKRNQNVLSNENSQENGASSILISDLRLCTIRPSNDHDRRYTFEIISPQNSHLLQSDSQIECDQWISMLQLTIANLFKSFDEIKINGSTSINERSGKNLISSKFEMRRKIIQEKIDFVRSIAGNEKCVDCDAIGPEWASINLGILFCLNCSGAHRGLGVNLSKVRSLHMDSWDLETLLVMSELGNTIVNSIYEARISKDTKKPTADSDPLTRRTFIEAKYVHKAFLRPLTPLNPVRSTTRTIKRWAVAKSSTNENDDDSSQSFRINRRNFSSRRPMNSNELEPDSDASVPVWNVNMFLYESARRHQVSTMLHALALGAEKNFRNNHDHGRTPLIQTIRNRSVAAAEFLLSNSAKVNLADEHGRTALHYATELAKKGRGPIILLLKRGADPLLRDHQGVDACSLAMTIADPDVVTWYRLIVLHEQMKDDDDNVEKSYVSILDDPVYMNEIARTPSFSQ